MRNIGIALLSSLLLCATAARPSAQYDSPFMQECRKLIELNDVDGIGLLIKKNEKAAVLAVFELCDSISKGSSDILENEIDALGKAWRKAYGTRFVTIVYNYLSVELSPPLKKQRRELLDRYNLRIKEYTSAEQAKDTTRFPALGQEFNALGDQFADLGDHFMAGQSYRVYAVCFDEGLNGSKADYRLACEGWGLYLQGRERIELRDNDYIQAKARFDALEADGFGEPEKGPEARAAALAEANPAYKPIPLGAQFELLADIESIQRPLYTADSNFQVWPVVLGLSKIDTKGTIPTMEKSPSVLRTGANKAAVDVDGDGQGDADIPLTGKIAAVQCTLDGKRPWGFLAVIGQQRDIYQGFAMNLAPDENQMQLYVAPAGSLVGTVETVRVRVIDDNMDGFYGSPPKGWGYLGLRAGSFQNDVDSVVVGESKLARPWSRLQKIGEAWFKLEANQEGTDLEATRTDLETGFLQLDLKGAPASWVIVRGGPDKDLYFDVANGGTNKVEVPIGTYELYSGQVASGKKAQMMKALILPGGTTRSWKVGKGVTVKMELGAPFGFDFRFSQDEENVTVEGSSIVVVGRGGESYQRMWNCVLSPEVLVRKAGSSKGKKETKLVPATSQEMLDEIKDYQACWFPIGKPFPKPGRGDTVELQLFEKKNKLFGKIESDWKAN